MFTHKYKDMYIHGYFDRDECKVTGYSIDPNKIFKSYLAAAPQPPEAAPVKLPEPVAWMLGCQTLGGDVGWKLSWSQSGAGVCNRLAGKEFEHALYTEQQVRELLEQAAQARDAAQAKQGGAAAEIGKVQP